MPPINHRLLSSLFPFIYKEKGINIAWLIYAQSVMLPLTNWQQSDIQNFFNDHQVCWNYCRDAGKTEKMSHIAVFGVLIGKEVMWISSYWKQLDKAQVYWNRNPYVQPFKISRTRDQIEIINGMRIQCVGATEANVRGPHTDWILYDEVSQMDEDVWSSSLDIGSHADPVFRLYASTPVYGSLFHKLTEQFPTYTHTYKECPWLNQTEIEDRKRYMNLKKWEQEELAVFTLLNGAVFVHNIVTFDGYAPDCVRIRQGVDFGGGKPHTLVRIGEYGGKLYVLGEWAFDPANPIEESNLTQLAAMFDTEAETGGSNNVYTHLTPMAMKVPFTEQTKYEKFQYLLRNTIAINPKLTPHTYEDINKAQYDDHGKIDTHPLDYLSALLHAGQVGQSIVDVPTPLIQGRRPIRSRI